MNNPEVMWSAILMYIVFFELFVGICYWFVSAVSNADDTGRIQKIYYATDDDIKYADSLFTSGDRSAVRLEERIEKETGVSTTGDMLEMAICAQKGKIIDPSHFHNSSKHLRIHTRFAIWLYGELRNHGFPYKMRCRSLEDARVSVRVEDIPIWDITPFKEGESCFSFDNYPESTDTRYAKNMNDTMIRLRCEYRVNPLDYGGRGSGLLTKVIDKRKEYKKFFIETYGATDLEIESAKHDIQEETEEVRAAREKIRNEAGVDPTNERVLRTLLAKKIRILPRDLMRGIFVRDNPEEQKFIVWYNEELMANGFPFSMQYIEKDNQKEYIQNIAEVKLS